MTETYVRNRNKSKNMILASSIDKLRHVRRIKLKVNVVTLMDFGLSIGLFSVNETDLVLVS